MVEKRHFDEAQVGLLQMSVWGCYFFNRMNKDVQRIGLACGEEADFGWYNRTWCRLCIE